MAEQDCKKIELMIAYGVMITVGSLFILVSIFRLFTDEDSGNLWSSVFSFLIGLGLLIPGAILMSNENKKPNCQ